MHRTPASDRQGKSRARFPALTRPFPAAERKTESKNAPRELAVVWTRQRPQGTRAADPLRAPRRLTRRSAAFRATSWSPARRGRPRSSAARAADRARSASGRPDLSPSTSSPHGPAKAGSLVGSWRPAATRVPGSQRSGWLGSSPQTLCAPSASRTALRQTRRCPCARPSLCLRAARAPCTGTSPGSSPAQSDPGGVVGSIDNPTPVTTGVCCLRQSEVEQLCAGLGQHDIAGLEIAMHDAPAVGLVERTRDLRSQSSAPERAGSAPFFQVFRQRRAFQVLHHQEGDRRSARRRHRARRCADDRAARWPAPRGRSARGTADRRPTPAGES